jgi:hypothetical protein
VSSSKSWGAKLDPYSRMQMEDGLPAEGVDVTVRVTDERAAAKQLERAGLKVHAQVGDIIVGHANSADLRQIAELDCVQEVQLSRPLYGEGSGDSEKER